MSRFSRHASGFCPRSPFQAPDPEPRATLFADPPVLRHCLLLRGSRRPRIRLRSRAHLCGALRLTGHDHARGKPGHHQRGPHRRAGPGRWIRRGGCQGAARAAVRRLGKAGGRVRPGREGAGRVHRSHVGAPRALRRDRGGRRHGGADHLFRPHGHPRHGNLPRPAPPAVRRRPSRRLRAPAGRPCSGRIPRTAAAPVRPPLRKGGAQLLPHSGRRDRAAAGGEPGVGRCRRPGRHRGHHLRDVRHALPVRPRRRAAKAHPAPVPELRPPGDAGRGRAQRSARATTGCSS